MLSMHPIVINMLLRFLLDLDEHLLCALDRVCHENQLTSYPVSRGRNSEEFVFEKYPELVSEIEGDKRRRIDSMRLRSHINRIEALEGKSRAASYEKSAESPLAQKTRPAQHKDNLAVASQSPALRPKQSSNDLMFQMDDDSLLSPGDTSKGKAAVQGTRKMNEGFPSLNASTPRSAMLDSESFGAQNYLDGQMASSQDTALGESPTEYRADAVRNKNGQPSATSPQVAWNSSDLSTSKKNLKDIMTEASETRVSNLSLGMSDRRESSSNAVPKLSQKERKKIQQQQMQDMLTAQQKAKEAPQNPWKLPTPNKTPSKPSPFATINGEGSSSSEAAKSAQKPSMTLRQTVAGTPPTPKASPAATAPVQIQNRSASASAAPPRSSVSGPSAVPPSPSPNPSSQTQPGVRSVRHVPRPEPYKTSFHSDSPSSMSLAAILMQQQTEKDEIREAATAKHNLEDIQAEQQFQEWWDKESRRIQGLPDLEETPSPQGDTRGGGGGGRGGRGKGPSGQQRKRRGKPTAPSPSTTPAGTSSPGVSALSQQLPRHPKPDASAQKQKPPTGPRRDSQARTPSSGNHPESTTHTGGSHPRRGGRGGGGRGRGKDRADRQHSNKSQPTPTPST